MLKESPEDVKVFNQFLDSMNERELRLQEERDAALLLVSEEIEAAYWRGLNRGFLYSAVIVIGATALILLTLLF